MKKLLMYFTVFCMMVAQLPMQKIHAAGTKINIDAKNVSGYSAKDHPVSNVVDGNKKSFWQSIPSNGEGAHNDPVALKKRMHDHYRYIDISLDGVYSLSEIKMFTNNKGFNHYYVYASLDGENYSRIITKDSDTNASEQGDSFTLSNVKAAYLRINMAYHSESFHTHLNEIEVYGTKTNDPIQKPKPISVSNWQGSTWQQEWDKFEQDKAYANQKTIKEMSNLVERVIGKKYRSNFVFELRSELSGNDVFEIEDGTGDQVIIRGNDGVSLASGFNYYLKNFAGVDYNPLFESNTTMPTKWVKVGKKIVKETQYDIRYALNFCTYSYTMSFWNWDEYQEFLDWAAMNGLNLILDIVGQEEVLRQTFKEYHYTDEEIKQYLPGPAYFAWFYMQNLYSFGGPLPNSWFEERTELGRQIHDRMQTYGITPVMQGFCGQVPADFVDKNPEAQATELQSWTAFTRPTMLKTYLDEADIAANKPDYFAKVARTFYEKQRNVFGDISNYYAADPFHEGGNLPAGATWQKIYKTVQDTMLKADKDAIWVMQQWQMNLTNEKLSGLSKPQQALALDLISDMNAENWVMENHQVPWVWCMLHNFGGRMGLDGELPKISSKPAVDYAQKQYMKGIGITPEALENSPVTYEMLFDMTWSSDPIDVNKWVEKYAKRRAGGTSETLQQAWDILLKTAYRDKGTYVQGAGESVVNARPTSEFSAASSWGHNNVFYQKEELDKALKLLIDNYDAFKNSPAYRYDLADVAEQVLSNAALEYHKLMVNAYNSGDSAEFKRVSTHFLELIKLSDQILQTSDEFMVDTWINDARKMIPNADDWTKDLFEFNARALITTWCGERNGGLKDYSNRKWAGLTKDFYLPRWQMWVSNRQAELDGTAKDAAAAKAESNWLLWEWKWANKKSNSEKAPQPNYTNLKQLATTALNQYSATSLKEFGGQSVSGKLNLSKGKEVVTNPETSKELRDILTDGKDGNATTLWNVKSTAPYTFTLDLGKVYEVNDITIKLRQLAKEFPYTYKVEILNEQNTWEVVGQNKESETIGSNTKIDLGQAKGKNTSSIRVTLTNRDANDSLEVAELEVMGKEVQQETLFNVAKGKQVTSTRDTDTSGAALATLTDDDTTNLWKTVWSDPVEGMYPTTVELDLAYACDSAKFVEVHFEKEGLPFKFHVETLDASGTATTIFTEENKKGTLEKKSYKVAVPTEVSEVQKVKVVFDGTTKQGQAYGASPAMCEVKVLAQNPEEQQNPIENLALKKPVTVSSTNPWDHTPAWNKVHITDGDLATGWSYDGDVDHDKGNAEVDLLGTYDVEEIKLTFNKENYVKAYIFDIYVVNDKGQKEVIFTENGPNKESYSVKINKAIQKVGVDYKGKSDPSVNGWFDIAELEAMGRKPVTDSGVIFGDSKEAITGVSASAGYDKTVDGDKGDNSFNLVEAPISYDLGGCYYVDRAVFTFEKQQLGIKYRVLGVDMNGTQFVISDQSNRRGTLGEGESTARFDVSVPVKTAVTKIIFEHLGNNGDGPAYAAEKRLYEAQFFKGSALDITEGSTGAMFDNNEATKESLSAKTAVEKTFAKPYDVNLIHLMATKGNVKIELFDEAKQAWVVAYHGAASASKWIALETSVFTKKLRITPSVAMEVSEISIYEKNTSALLDETIQYVQGLLNTLEAKPTDGTNGSYQAQAKTKAKEELTAIITALNEGKANGMSSVDVSKKKVAADQVMTHFEETGKFFISRGELLDSISQAEQLIAKLTAAGMDQDAKKLTDAKNEARKVCNNYNASQAQIDEAKVALDAAIHKVPEIVPSYKKALQAKLEEALKKNESEYTVSSYKELDTAIKNAQAKLEQAKLTEQEANEAITSLTNAMKGLKPRANKETATNALATLESLKKEDYTSKSWDALMDAKKELVLASNNTADISVEQMQALVNALADAKEALVDVKALKELVKEIEQSLSSYTTSSTKQMKNLLKDAKALYTNGTKVQVEQSIQALTNEQDKLVKIADVKALQAKLDELQAKKLDASLYTDASWKTYQEALAQASAIVKDASDVSQKEADQALNALNKAFTDLKKQPAEKPQEETKPQEKPQEETKPENPQQGGQEDSSNNDKEEHSQIPNVQDETGTGDTTTMNAFFMMMVSFIVGVLAFVKVRKQQK